MSDEKQYLKRKKRLALMKTSLDVKLPFWERGRGLEGGGYFNLLPEKERVNNRRSWLGTRGPTSDGFYFNGKKI